ncbi:MAG: DUF1016 family protein [Cytophagales bacterium]|nr:MAG: DUF1016 family protein [Cytophagales bacterium]
MVEHRGCQVCVAYTGFLRTNHQHSILQPVVAEVSGSHNLVILDRCKDDHERLFYSQQTRRNGWSKLTSPSVWPLSNSPTI